VRSRSSLLGGTDDVIGLDEASTVQGGSGQSVVGEGVDVAHEAAGGREEGLEGGVGEEGAIDAGEAEAVLEVEAGGVTVEAREGVADGDALGERLEVGEAELATQARLTGEQEGETVLSVPVEVRQ
jgi:hypothetical protein